MADYSSYVTIQLSSSVPALNLENQDAMSGSFSPSPPSKIEQAEVALRSPLPGLTRRSIRLHKKMDARIILKPEDWHTG